MLVIRNVDKLKPNGQYLFQDVSLEIDRGIVAITGRSGSGKSTLLKCIAYLTPFDKGEILLDNKLFLFQ